MNADKELLECAKLVEHLAKEAMHDHDDDPKLRGKTDRKKTRNLLRSIEWSMGNGQCFFCYGHKPRAGWWTATVGHENSCGLASLIESLGEKPMMIKENKSKSRFHMERWSKRVVSEMLKQHAKS